MSFNLFSNPIGRHEKRYFVYKEIKLIETEMTCPNWHREWVLKRKLEFYVSISWTSSSYSLFQMSCLFDSILGLSFLFWEVGCLLILTLAMVYRNHSSDSYYSTHSNTHYVLLSLISVTSHFWIRKNSLKKIEMTECLGHCQWIWVYPVSPSKPGLKNWIHIQLTYLRWHFAQMVTFHKVHMFIVDSMVFFFFLIMFTMALTNISNIVYKVSDFIIMCGRDKIYPMPGTVLRIWEEVKKSKTSLSLWGPGKERDKDMITLLWRSWSRVALEKSRKEEKVLICGQDVKVT